MFARHVFSLRAAPLRWLASEYAARMDLVPLWACAKGNAKPIFLGAQDADTGVDYPRPFVELARESWWVAAAGA